VIFATGEVFFARLLNELNAVLRSPGVSVWQAQQLREHITPLKARLWGLWWLSLTLKIIGATAGLLASRATLRTDLATMLPTVGYSSLFLGLPILWVMVHGFKQIEKLRDDLAFEELKFKERKRLREDLAKGESHDFDKDEVLQGYSKPAQPQ
jgi:hypothetical protein